jgi:hypothetical protein
LSTSPAIAPTSKRPWVAPVVVSHGTGAPITLLCSTALPAFCPDVGCCSRSMMDPCECANGG